MKLQKQMRLKETLDQLYSDYKQEFLQSPAELFLNDARIRFFFRIVTKLSMTLKRQLLLRQRSLTEMSPVCAILLEVCCHEWEIRQRVS